MSREITKRQTRGLRWIFGHAHADFSVCEEEEERTGQFSGTSANEVADALDWLHERLIEAESKHKLGRFTPRRQHVPKLKPA